MAELSDKQVVDWILSCREEADEAKRDRMNRNKENFDMFHLKHDFSHKDEGQSTEVLSRQSMAVEQIKSFFQQALADLGDWWKASCRYAHEEAGLPLRSEEITKLTNYYIEDANYFSHVGNSIESGLLGALSISKVYATMKPKHKYVARKKGRGKSFKRWLEKVEDETLKLNFDTIRATNYYPDPTGKGLYEIEESFPDFNEVLRLAEDGVYDLEAVRKLPRSGETETLDEADKARETGQNTSSHGHRPSVKITEFWGSIIDPTSGEICYRNCVATIANDTHLIRKPEPNPLWHQSSPYSAAALLEVANSVWHKALMDAPTCHNRALIELYNLMIDAAMKQTHAISQIRVDCLQDPAEIANGIKDGQALKVNMSLPVGGKVLEPLTQVQVPQEAFNIFNIMGQEFNSSALTNDLRQGVMPFRAVKATEVVEASQTITSVFQGIAKNYEARKSTKELELAWMTIAQNWDRIDKDVFIALFGPERGKELKEMSPQEVFAATVGVMKFQVFGVSLTLAKAQDFRKLTTLAQTVFANPILAEEFMKKYDPGKYLGEIMTSLDIDKSKLEIPMAQQQTMMQPQEGQPVEPGADMMSQVPQAGAGSLQDLMGGGPGIPQSEFPGSPATQGGDTSY